MTDERLAVILRSNRLKKTTRRMAVARMMLDSGRTATPAQVWSALRPKLGRLGLPSVYRILEELTEAGLLTRIVRPEAESELCYAACTADRRHHHHHLVCTGCGRVEVVDCSFRRLEESRIRRRTGFKVTGHTIQVQGICPACGDKGN